MFGHLPDDSSEPSQHWGSIYAIHIHLKLFYVYVPHNPSLTLELGINAPM